MSAPLYPVLTGLQQTSFQPAPPPGSQFAPTLIIHGQQPIVIPSQQPILPVSHPHEYPNHQPWTPGGVQTTSFITPPPPPPSSQPPTAPRESALYKDDLSILPVETNHETRGTNYKDIHTVNVEKSVVVHVSRETQTVGLEFGYDGTVAFPKPNDKVVPNKKGKVLTVLGALQIVIGIILILDNVGIISISKQFTRYFAPGIWGGIMFIASGAMGIRAGKGRTSKLVFTFVFLSTISSLTGVVVFIIYALETATQDDIWEGTGYVGFLANNALLVIVSALEVLLALVGAVCGCGLFCCQGCCECCGMSADTGAAMTSETAGKGMAGASGDAVGATGAATPGIVGGTGHDAIGTDPNTLVASDTVDPITAGPSAADHFNTGDTLVASHTNDPITSGSAGGYIVGTPRNATGPITGGSGNTTGPIIGGSSNTTGHITGGSGNTTGHITGGSGNTTGFITGGSGNATGHITGGSGNTTGQITYGSGNTTGPITGGSGNTTGHITGGSGNTTGHITGGSNTTGPITGGSGNTTGPITYGW